MTRRCASLAALVLLLSAAGAHAGKPSTAWKEAAKVLPGGLPVVGGVNFASIRASGIYKKVAPMLLASQGPESKATMEQIKSVCKIDVMGAIDSVAFAMADPSDPATAGKPQGAVAIGFRGLNEAKLTACVTKMAKAKKEPIAIAKGPDGIVELTHGTKKLYFKFIAPTVALLAGQAEDKAMLSRMLAGKGAIARLPQLARTDTSASGWAIYAKGQQLAPGANVTGFYGSADLARGKLSIKANLVAANAKDAAGVTKMVQETLESMKQQLSQMPAFAAVAKSVTVKTVASETMVTASMPEKDLMGLIGMAMRGGF